MPSANIGERTVTDNQTKCLIPAVVVQALLLTPLPRAAQSIILTALRRDETCRKLRLRDLILLPPEAINLQQSSQQVSSS